MRRHALGAVGVLFLAVWLGLMLTGAEAGVKALAASAMRIGLVLLALWLALPQLQQITTRFPPWLLGALAATVVLLAVRPRMAVYVLPIVAAIIVLQFVGWLFKPQPRKPPR